MTTTRRLAVALLLLMAAGTGAAPGKAESLDIDPQMQRTRVWCWLAVGEMIFSHYGVPNLNPMGNFQCGIIGVVTLGTGYHACSMDCRRCEFPAGSAENMRYMLETYPVRARQLEGVGSTGIAVELRSSPLSKRSLVREIDAGNPVVAGINPSGRPPGAPPVSQHVALVVGYEDDGEILIVNDPYPFYVDGWHNPYLASGGEELEPLQYRIAYSDFRHGLDWAESMTLTSYDLADEELSYPSYCCVMGQKYGPFENNSIPEGASCQIILSGYVYPGQACY